MLESLMPNHLEPQNMELIRMKAAHLMFFFIATNIPPVLDYKSVCFREHRTDAHICWAHVFFGSPAPHRKTVQAQQTKARLFEVASHWEAAIGLLWPNQLFLHQLSELRRAPPPPPAAVPLHMSPAGLCQHDCICLSSSNVPLPVDDHKVQFFKSVVNRTQELLQIYM